MHFARTLAATAAAVAMLTSCGHDDAETTFIPDDAFTVAAPDATTDDSVDIGALRESAPYFTSVPTGTIRHLGHNVCESLDLGMPITDVVSTGTESGVPAGAVGALIGFGVNAYCPEHLAELTTWAAQ
jgi:hypothetical protein